MSPEVTIVDAPAGQWLAAVHASCPHSKLADTIYQCLDRVWPLVRSAGMDFGHNVVVYLMDEPKPELDVEIGVQVAAPFEPVDGHPGVRCVEMPSGRTAVAIHVGPYDQLATTYSALDEACHARGLDPTGISWEVYGDWNDDPAQLETTLHLQLR